MADTSNKASAAALDDLPGKGRLKYMWFWFGMSYVAIVSALTSVYMIYFFIARYGVQNMYDADLGAAPVAGDNYSAWVIDYLLPSLNGFLALVILLPAFRRLARVKDSLFELFARKFQLFVLVAPLIAGLLVSLLLMKLTKDGAIYMWFWKNVVQDRGKNVMNGAHALTCGIVGLLINILIAVLMYRRFLTKVTNVGLKVYKVYKYYTMFLFLSSMPAVALLGTDLLAWLQRALGIGPPGGATPPPSAEDATTATTAPSTTVDEKPYS